MFIYTKSSKIFFRVDFYNYLALLSVCKRTSCGTAVTAYFENLRTLNKAKEHKMLHYETHLVKRLAYTLTVVGPIL